MLHNKYGTIEFMQSFWVDDAAKSERNESKKKIIYGTSQNDFNDIKTK